MMSEFLCLFIPFVTLWVLYFYIDLKAETNSQWIPVTAFGLFLYFCCLFFYEGDKNDLFEKPHIYECSPGKVVFYNFGNVICIDGEKAKMLK